MIITTAMAPLPHNSTTMLLSLGMLPKLLTTVKDLAIIIPPNRHHNTGLRMAEPTRVSRRRKHMARVMPQRSTLRHLIPHITIRLRSTILPSTTGHSPLMPLHRRLMARPDGRRSHSNHTRTAAVILSSHQ